MKASLIKTTVILVIIFGCLSCEEPEEAIRVFTIREGEHYSTPRIAESLQGNTLEFEAMFTSSAIYKLDNEALQSNKNKLLGFSDCNSLHHENSARFAWQWFNNQLEIYAYTYVNGQREEAFVGVIPLNAYSHFKIVINKDSYQFELNNHQPVVMSRGTTCQSGAYYKLWPYFGGSVPAPHDIQIAIKTLY